MLTRKVYPTLIATVILLLAGTPLHAGGWVVVTLDTLPPPIYAGEAITIGFTVRQHGQTLVDLGEPGPAVVAEQVETGARMMVAATRTGFTGHYTATLTFPAAGRWAWHIAPKPFPTVATMPDLIVEHRSQPLALPTNRDPFFYQWLALAQQWLRQWGVEPVKASAPDEALEPSLGRDLFLAKGCASCHMHEDLAVEWNSQVGPDLTNYDKTAAFLQLWLTEPTAVKPTTMMPNLQLSQAEINALSVFLINADTQ